MPKIIFPTLDAVPEWARADAKTEGEGVAVDLVQSSKLAEFRENNIKLSTEKEELTKTVATLSGIVGEDPESFATTLAELRRVDQEVKDGKLKGSDAVAKEVDARISALKTDYEKQVQKATAEGNAWKDKATGLDTRLKRTHIDREVTAAVLNEASGAEPRALGDILTRAYAVFSVDDNGKLIAKDGEATIYGADGTTSLQPLEWLEKLKEPAPYFFKNSSGGGAGGSGNTTLPGNMTQADFAKLSGAEQLKLARSQQKK